MRYSKLAGYNVNIAWNEREDERMYEIGDEDYAYAFEHCIMPIATKFDPQLILVSAGFDAVKGDPLGGCGVSPEGFAYMTHQLMSLANGRVVLCLEGGYNLDATAHSMSACVQALQGTPPSPWLDNKPPKKLVQDAVAKTCGAHCKMWGLDLSHADLSGNAVSDSGYVV